MALQVHGTPKARSVRSPDPLNAGEQASAPERIKIVVFDLDHFKRVNDELGHAAGDRILRAIAQLLHDQKRSSDFLARYGEEEFVMLLPRPAGSPIQAR